MRNKQSLVGFGISTTILMQRFFSNHVVSGMDIPLALHEAQLLVRDLTYSQVVGYIEKCYCLREWKGESKEFIEQYGNAISKWPKISRREAFPSSILLGSFHS